MNETKRPKLPVLRIALTLVFCGGVVWMGSMIIQLQRRSGVVEAENQELLADVKRIRDESQRLESGRKSMSDSKDLVEEMMRLCRTVDDFPEFGDRIAASCNGDRLLFYVPEGEHWLWITTDAKSKNGTVASPFRGMERKRVRLRPRTRYKFEIKRDSEQIGWTLVSSDPEFERIEKRLPHRVNWSGRSWSSEDELIFPNQFRSERIWRAESENRPLSLLATTHHGRVGNDQAVLEIGFRVDLESDGPWVASASEAGSIRRFGDEKLIGEYLGDGRYLVDQEAVRAYYERKAKREGNR